MKTSPEMSSEPLRRLIRDVMDFPKSGIIFKDIAPLLASPGGLDLAIELMAAPFHEQRIDLVVGAESRGFIFGAAIARALSAGFIPIRKPGKLPLATHAVEYGLEYGVDRVEIHQDAISAGQRVLMVDDLLATGGTMRACCDLVEKLMGEIVGATVLIELAELNGRAKLGRYRDVHAVLKY